ncbi:hypothetical protein Tco_0455732 [Tanacetum coccineum]
MIPVTVDHVDVTVLPLISSGGLPTWVMMNPSSMFSGVESTCPTTAIDCFTSSVIITKSLQNLKNQEMVNILVSGEA